MNIDNNVSFHGKREIMYGLNKASKAAKDAQVDRLMSCGPYRVNRIDEAKKNIAVMNAYLDMAINDNEFKNVIESISKDTDTKKIAENLKYLDTMQVFKRAFAKNVVKIYGNAKAINLSNLWQVLAKK